MATPRYLWPNHYHALVEAPDIKRLLHELGLLHGRTSHDCNGEERARGRKVFFRAVERAMRSARHYCAGPDCGVSPAWDSRKSQPTRLPLHQILMEWGAHPPRVRIGSPATKFMCIRVHSWLKFCSFCPLDSVPHAD